MGRSGGNEGSTRAPLLEFTRLTEMIESGAPQEEIDAQVQRIEASPGVDRFQLIQMMPHFLRAARSNLNAPDQFRLPGQDRVVHDHRDDKSREGRQAREAHARDHVRSEEKNASRMELRRGRLVESAEKDYENYFGERVGRGETLKEPSETMEQLSRLLSKFEKIILERFEQGREIAQRSQDGRATFLEKTEAQWREFFSNFRERMIGKKVSLDEIEEFLFRGLVAKGERGILISDMTLKDGRVEKFIRFNIIADLLAKFAALKPGDSFGIDKLTGMERELMYLALAASKGRELSTSPLPTAGKFISSKAEGEAARELGIAQGEPTQQGRSQIIRSKRSWLAGLFGEKEPEPEETPYQFVPWWSWGRLKKPPPFRWTTTVFYGTLLILSLIGIILLTYRLLSGS